MIKEYEWYDANYDKRLVEERLKVQDLCFAYNQIMPSNLLERKNALQSIVGYETNNVEIISPFLCDYGKNIYFGHDVFVNANSYFMDGAKIHVGNHVYIGPDCGFYTANHPLNVQMRNHGFEMACPITIEDNVWIGAKVCVMPGVTIGANSVIAAGSVVTKDIPANVLAAGVPCKVKKELTDEIFSGE